MENQPAPEEEPGDAEVDRAFREIVAGLRAERGPSSRVNPPWPTEPPARRHPGPGTPEGMATEPPARRHLGPGTPEGMATDHRSYQPPDVEEEHFVPPPPPPLPAGDLHFWGIVVGLVLGPLLLVLSAILPVLHAAWAILGLLLTVTGFVLLVLRQPPRRSLGDDDDGARV